MEGQGWERQLAEAEREAQEKQMRLGRGWERKLRDIKAEATETQEQLTRCVSWARLGGEGFRAPRFGTFKEGARPQRPRTASHLCLRCSFTRSPS